MEKKERIGTNKMGSGIQPEEVEVVLTENKSDPEVKTKNFKYIFLLIFVPKDLLIQGSLIFSFIFILVPNSSRKLPHHSESKN